MKNPAVTSISWSSKACARLAVHPSPTFPIFLNNKWMRMHLRTNLFMFHYKKTLDWCSVLNRRVDEARNALLHNFSSRQTSLAAVVIGLVAGLFALIQVVQNTPIPSLSSMFPISMSSFLPMFELGCAFSGIHILSGALVYTAFRYIIYSYLSTALVYLRASEVVPTQRSIHAQIIMGCWNKVKDRKVLGLLPARFFRANQWVYGIIWCAIIAIFPTFVILLIAL